MHLEMRVNSTYERLNSVFHQSAQTTVVVGKALRKLVIRHSHLECSTKHKVKGRYTHPAYNIVSFLLELISAVQRNT